MNYFRIRIIVFAFYVLSSSCLLSQKRELSEEELNIFEEELIYKYELFSESILNIIDDRLDINDKYRARSILVDQFATTTSTISDYFSIEEKSTLPVYKYSYKLFDHEVNSALFFKKFKFSDSLRISSTVKGIKDKYLKDKTVNASDKTYSVYKGDLFFLEKILNSEYLTDTEFEVFKNEYLKKVDFRIIHNENDKYEIQIDQIKFIDKRDATYNYEELSDEVISSSILWSDKAEEEYFNEMVDSAIKKGFIEKQSYIEEPIELTETSKSILPSEKDLPAISDPPSYSSLSNSKPSILQYLVPPIGHLKFGPTKNRKRDFIVHSLSVAAPLTLAINYEVRSKNQLNKSKLEVDVQVATQLEERSIRNDKRAKIFWATTASAYTISMLHLKAKVRRNNSIIEESDLSKVLELNLAPSKISVVYNF